MLDKRDFVRLIDQSGERLFRVAKTILPNNEDCKDALQECVLKAWAARHSLREESFFLTWVTRILINECRSLSRKQQREACAQAAAREEGPPAPDPFVREALYGLAEKYRLPLVLHYLEGYTMKEIAQMLRVPVTTVRGRLYEGRRMLKGALGEGKEALDG